MAQGAVGDVGLAEFFGRFLGGGADLGSLIKGGVACCRSGGSEAALHEAMDVDLPLRSGFADDVAPLAGHRSFLDHEKVVSAAPEGRQPAVLEEMQEEAIDCDAAVDVDAGCSVMEASPLELLQLDSPIGGRIGGKMLGKLLPGGAPTTSEPTISGCSTSVGSRYSFHSDGLEDRGPISIDEGEGTYTGQWLGELRHGWGSAVWSSGQHYDGQFRHDQPTGRGAFTEADGSTFDGRWENGKRHGHGIYRYADGTVYDGLWVDDQKSGSGSESWTDGTRYEGQYCKGLKHGTGIYTGIGTHYVGEFEQDRMHGEGSFTFQDGRVFFGQWVRGKMHGDGRMEWPSGAVYDGTFRDGRRSGHGMFTHNEKAYSGLWLAGKKHGVGYSDNGDGQWEQEFWRDGEKISADSPGKPLRTEQG